MGSPGACEGSPWDPEPALAATTAFRSNVKSQSLRRELGSERLCLGCAKGWDPSKLLAALLKAFLKEQQLSLQQSQPTQSDIATG